MNKYSIPTTYLPGFKSIVKLNDEELEKLANVLIELTPGQSFNRIFEKSKVFLTSLSEQQLHEIISSLVSIVDIFENAKRDIDTFTTDFSDSYLTSNALASPEDRDILKKNLTVLLKSYDIIRLTTKSQDIILANPSNFKKARIISDIRPVFAENLDESKKIAVLVHNLRLEYLKNGKTKEFFISLDITDLRNIKDIIDRAIQKDAIIRSNKYSLDFIDIV